MFSLILSAYGEGSSDDWKSHLHVDCAKLTKNWERLSRREGIGIDNIILWRDRACMCCRINFSNNRKTWTSRSDHDSRRQNVVSSQQKTARVGAYRIVPCFSLTGMESACSVRGRDERQGRMLSLVGAYANASLATGGHSGFSCSISYSCSTT